MFNQKPISSIGLIGKTKTTRLHIIDFSNFFNRAWYATPQLKTSKGVHVNAVKGFVNMLDKINRDMSPTHLVIVFDGRNSRKYRVDMYPDYKGTRKKDPKKEKEFNPQFKIADRLLQACNIHTFAIEGIEADDVIGALVKANHNKVDEVYIHSSDKDFGQLLVKDNIFQCRPGSQTKEPIIVSKSTCIKEYGVNPRQIINLLQMTGDTVDAIPGVPGIGHVKASKLLNEYGNMKSILDNLDSMSPSFKKSFDSVEIDLALSYKLIKLKLDIKEVSSVPVSKYKVVEPNIRRLKKIKKDLEFNSSILGY